MTSGRDEGLKRSKWLKADSESLLPGPGARTFWAKIMRQPPFHGPGGPLKLRIVDCEMWIEKQMLNKSEIHNSKSEIGRPILFVQKVLASGPRARHSGNVDAPKAGMTSRF
jgi:hypothetical protein